jgi:hypothetical protein
LHEGFGWKAVDRADVILPERDCLQWSGSTTFLLRLVANAQIVFLLLRGEEKSQSAAAAGAAT